MEFVKRIKFIDIFISAIISVYLTVFIYSKLYPLCTYSNLKDLYVGTTIFTDHNKYLDLSIYFIYVAIFLILTFLFSFLGKRENKDTVNNKPEKEEIKENKFRNILIKLQYFGLLGFIFLHPINNNLYPKMIFIITAIIITGIYDTYKCQRKSEFSAFTITGCLFLAFFTAYTIGYLPIDDHHYGERFATFFLHNKYGLEYYKDIMLVHGYMDVIPSWLGCHILNTNNIYGFSLGDILFKNICFILTVFIGTYVFKSEKYFIIPLVLIPANSICSLYFVTFLLLIKLADKKYFLVLYTILSFFFCIIWTTIGSFCLISSIPIVLYHLIKNYNKKYIIISIASWLLLILLFKTPLLYYFIESKEYIKGYLFSFGNNFDNFIPYFVIVITVRIFALLYTPVLIIQLFKELNEKDKNIKNILFLVFFIIFTIISLSYTLGRIDGVWFQRLNFISTGYLYVVLPYFLYIYLTSKQKKVIKIILTAILVFNISLNLYKLPYKIKNYELKHNINHESRINEISEFLKNHPQYNSFFDITNRGMHYLYLNKKCPIKYVSFYNSITTNQSLKSLEKLKKNPPDIILINSDNILHDGIFPSLRINPIYRWMLLSGIYSYERYKNQGFLVKTNNSTYTQSDKKDLDYILSYGNLKFLPEVWAKSLSTLPIAKSNPNFKSYIYKNKLIIEFEDAIKGKDIDLLYISNNISSESKYFININSSESEIICYSKSGKLLIPLDNFPSWLLNEDIKSITIESKGFINPEIYFYNRLENIKEEE